MCSFLRLSLKADPEGVVVTESGRASVNTMTREKRQPRIVEMVPHRRFAPYCQGQTSCLLNAGYFVPV